MPPREQVIGVDGDESKTLWLGEFEIELTDTLQNKNTKLNLHGIWKNINSEQVNKS